MKWLLSLFGGNVYGYLIGGAIISLLSIGATSYIVSNAKNVEIANLQRDAANQKAANVTASLQQLQSFIASMQTGVNDFTAQQKAIFDRLNAISAEFRNAIKANPLPLDCKPGPVRLRSLGNAVSAVNHSTAGQ